MRRATSRNHRRTIACKVLPLLLGCVGVFAFSAGLAGCHGGKRHRTVAVITKSTGTDQWRELRDGIQEGAAGEGWTMQWSAPESEADYTRQADMLEEAIKQRVDGILLQPAHQMVPAAAARRAHEAGIPLIIVDAPIALPSDQYTGFVGSNDVEIGLLAADRAASSMHGRACVGIVGVSPMLEGSSLRERSFRERLKQLAPETTVCATAYGLSDWGRSREAVRDMLDRNSRIGLLFASDAFGTLGAVAEVQRRRHRPLLIGLDNENARIAAVDRGEIDAIVLEDMHGIGRVAADMVRNAMNGSRTHRTEEMPVTLHTRGARP